MLLGSTAVAAGGSWIPVAAAVPELPGTEGRAAALAAAQVPTGCQTVFSSRKAEISQGP